MKANRLRWIMNIWPPYLAAGVRVREISPDYRYARVDLKLGWSNRNYVGVHFGGSLFAMADPFYMLMYMQNLGKDYVVWDRAAAIEFIKPGRGTVTAEFRLDEADIKKAKEGAAAGAPYLVDHDVHVVNAEGELVSRLRRTIYVRLKKRPAKGS